MAFDDDNMASDEDQGQDDDMDMEEEEEANDQDHDMDAGDDDEDDGDGEGDEDNGDDEDDDEDQNEHESPSRRASQHTNTRRSTSREGQAQPAPNLTSPSPRHSTARSPGTLPKTSFIPPVREIALNAQAYDIVPTMAAPQGTSINALAATPDMKWVFSGGTDGYVRMYNWMDTANGKVPLTVAQKHPFVDSVMKAGSLVTYWENEDKSIRTPPAQPDEGKWTSPVYSLAVHHQALWLLSGLESGAINLQTCRHQAGTIITTLKDQHTNAVSVLSLSHDEMSVLSGSWDKSILDWDLNTGQVKRSFKGSGGQISALEVRPISDLVVPDVSELPSEAINGTFSSNNQDKPLANGVGGLFGEESGDQDAAGSPDGSLFGEGDHGSLFGEDTGGGGTGAPGGGFDDDDALTRALESEMQGQDPQAEGDVKTATSDHAGPEPQAEPAPSEDVARDTANKPASEATVEHIAAVSDQNVDISTAVEGQDSEEKEQAKDEIQDQDQARQRSRGTSEKPGAIATNGLPHAEGPPTAPPTNEDEGTSTSSGLPSQSESTFLDAAQDGTIRIWDRRMPAPVATIVPYAGTPPWCTGACWSPDGNFFYVGRRNGSVEEYSIHNLGSRRSEPNRTFKFQQGSGPVYAVRAMPNKKHLLCASNDILRIYDLKQAETKHKQVPFTIVPGHRGGVISSIYVDPACRFMLSASGNRGWEGAGTEVLLGYEIGVQDDKGNWHK